eukprot:CAMPEP_0115454908 /NCGR_PEP_ID=MMETSP0271-20121206/43885_1 /TAXON_ID=71861 /ORGANISM="Scrippsiella trochoidea, Strain CCMP3099" /LENGTH=275 /DNA_ID=CAMNT_0002881347 /DNA_START=54 /DNA_END=878 /DNA_ORIENTATION=+
MSLCHDVQCSGFAKHFLVEPELVERLSVRRLVPTEPLPNPRDHAWHLFFNICNGLDVSRNRVPSVDGDDLPIELAVIDHCQRTENLDTQDLPLLVSAAPDLDNVQRVIVAENFQLWVFHSWILPSLRQISIIPKDRAMIVAQLALLYVLSDGIDRLLSCDLHLRLCHLRDLCDHPFLAIHIRVQRDVMPRRNLAAIRVEEESSETFGTLIAPNFGANLERVALGPQAVFPHPSDMSMPTEGGSEAQGPDQQPEKCSKGRRDAAVRASAAHGPSMA